MATFSKADFYKHNNCYHKAVVNSLQSSSSIKLGATGETSHIISASSIDFTDCYNMSYEQFNDFLISNFNIKWTQIFKGEFSGYKNGLLDNKGIAFEQEFIDNYSKYSEIISESLNESISSAPHTINHCGSNNTKRPLTRYNRNIVVGEFENINEVGALISDVHVIDNAKFYTYKEVDYSLKEGASVSFCNIGVSKLFPEYNFKKFAISNDINQFTAPVINSVSAIDLLNLLGIDAVKFANVFNNYNSSNNKLAKAPKETIDISNKINTSEFRNFVKSVIGAGYILVHKHNNKTHVYDIRSEAKLEKFIGDFVSAEVQYPLNGSAKRVDVLVKFSNIEIKFNIRNKQSGIYPTHIMADYKILN